MSKVLYERRGHVFHITINRPEVRNAVDPETGELLTEAYRVFRDDDEAFVSIIAGAGDKAFCAGADLKAVSKLSAVQPRSLVRDVDKARVQNYNSLGYMGYTRGIDIFKPTIAAVSGWCIAGGLELATWCDIRIAADNARFGMLNRRFNVPLVDGGTVRLPRIIGLGRALDLIITGRVIDAEQALQFGLVTEVVPVDKLMERATELAELICEHPQGSIRTDKESVLRSYGHDLGEAYFIEAELGALTELRDVTPQAGAATFAEGKVGRHGQRTGGK
ncbi:MAG: enoyl-CoA hydratase-related protein [Chloroflexota bacterium]|nr:enoyl-CoA hydratase-related protein [Chloroflexota bacterium]